MTTNSDRYRLAWFISAINWTNCSPGPVSTAMLLTSIIPVGGW